MTPIKAIRQNCIECSGGNVAEVARCPMIKCPLYKFRMGKNPNIKPRTLTEEQREAARVRLAGVRNRKD